MEAARVVQEREVVVQEEEVVVELDSEDHP